MSQPWSALFVSHLGCYARLASLTAAAACFTNMRSGELRWSDRCAELVPQ